MASIAAAATYLQTRARTPGPKLSHALGRHTERESIPLTHAVC
jgi:hypothetical protein